MRELIDGKEGAPPSNVWKAARGSLVKQVGSQPAHEAKWTLEAWLESNLNGMTRLVAANSISALLATAPTELRTPAGQRAVLHALGSSSEWRDTLQATVRTKHVALLEGLSTLLWQAVTDFATDADALTPSRASAAAHALTPLQQQQRTEALSSAADEWGGEGAVVNVHAAAMLWAHNAGASARRRALAFEASGEEESPDLPAATALELRHALLGQKLARQASAGKHLLPPALTEVSGSTHLYFASLEDLVGPPASGGGMTSMLLEHATSADAQVPFEAVCNGHVISTCSEVEWCLVSDPDKALELLKLSKWPRYAAAGEEQGEEQGEERTPLKLGNRVVAACDGDHFREKLIEINSRLERVGDSGRFTLELMCACRMYTGPVARKYIDVLRRARLSGGKASSSAASASAATSTSSRSGRRSRDSSSGGRAGKPSVAAVGFVASATNKPTADTADLLTQGNSYPSTLHYICAGMWKLSQLTQAVPVYCAPSLPQQLAPSFFEPSAESDGSSRGVVQLGSEEMATDRAAVRRTATLGGGGLIVQVQACTTCRGAPLEWLSQAPSLHGEDGVSFSPVTLCDVHRARSEGGIAVLELRPIAGLPGLRGSRTPGRV